jgi:prevent-host-death family protein
MSVTTVGMYEAKTHFSRLVRKVAEGNEVLILKAGTPIAKLVPYEPPAEPRKPGLLKGKFTIAPDFDEPLPDFEEAFYGE